MLAGLRRRFPAVSEKELHEMLMDQLVGKETAERVWGPRVESNR